MLQGLLWLPRGDAKKLLAFCLKSLIQEGVMTSQSNTQVGRGMSYRKPVPVYVPSPPSSPTIPLQALGLENNSQSQIPPVC